MKFDEAYQLVGVNAKGEKIYQDADDATVPPCIVVNGMLAYRDRKNKSRFEIKQATKSANP